MTLRISTAGLHQQGLSALLRRQVELARTQQDMTTGNRLTRAAEDPAGAAQAQRLDHAVAALESHGRSAGLLEHRLRLQEEALVDGHELLTRARTLSIQANAPTLSDQNRAAIAIELRQIQAQMLGVSNRADGNGRHLFAGQRDGVAPFAIVNGAVSYAGDDGRNLVEIGPEMSIADTDAGSDVFLRIRTGDGTIRAQAATGNNGTGVLQGTAVTNPGAWNGRALQLEFTAPGAWRMVDGPTVIASGTHAPGDSITAGGVQLRIDGTPATGDTFAIGRAPARDVFATLDALATALETPATTPQAQTQRANALSTALTDIATAQDHFVTLRTATGTRLTALDESADTRIAHDESLRATLSELRDVDYAEAASRLSLQLTAIEAAQRTLLRVQTLSLFDRMG